MRWKLLAIGLLVLVGLGYLALEDVRRYRRLRGM